MVTDVVHAKGGCIILLDVPPSSTITLDGVTRVTPSLSASTAAVSTQQQSSPFHRGLWIINNIPAVDNDFHLLVVRSGNRKEDTTNNTNTGDCRTLPVGFVISNDNTQTHQTTIANELGYQWILARKYDLYTEEISNNALDEITMKNIILAMEEGKELHQFVISYDQFMSTSSNSNNSIGNNNLPSWDKRTSMINSTFLQQYHQLSTGNKIVPSSESQDDTTKKNEEVEDGKSLSYPSIPCIDTTINARQLAQHSGTRLYLSKLSPETRTWILFGANSDTDDSKKKSPGEFILNDVLCRYYVRNNIDGDNNRNAKKSEENFLADVELSFIVFLFLECHASLEHWRDSISMCSLLTTTPNDDTPAVSSNIMVIQHPHFFQKLLSILYNQLSCIETEFFQDVEYSSGEDNFMIGALRRLCKACECDMGKRKRDGDAGIESLKTTSQKLRLMVRERFGLDLLLSENDNNDDVEMETDALWSATGEDYGGEGNNPERTSGQYEMDEVEEDDDDGPVIVDYDQVEASLARTSQTPKRQVVNQMHCEEYPLLYAAMSPQEDEVMACARILDEAKDVSLVREAAAYLEEVEAHRCKTY